MTATTKHRWRPEDIQCLRVRFALEHDVECLSERLGRTEIAVRAKASQLGLRRACRSISKGHQWTDAERAVVRARYRGTVKDAELIGESLGVSTNAVRHQVQALGLSRLKDRRSWTPEEDECLRELLETYAVATVAHRLNRSTNSIVVRSKRLGIKRRAHSGWYTKKEVCEILGEEHRWVQARIDSGKLKASWHDGQRPGGAGLTRWHINERDLCDYLMRYSEELLGRNVDITQIINIVMDGHNGNGRAKRRRRIESHESHSHSRRGPNHH